MENLRVIEGKTQQEQVIQIPAFVNQKGEAATRAYKERVAKAQQIKAKKRKVSDFADNLICSIMASLFVLFAGIGIADCLHTVIGGVWAETPTASKVAVIVSIGLTLFLLICNIFGKSDEEEKERG